MGLSQLVGGWAKGGWTEALGCRCQSLLHLSPPSRGPSSQAQVKQGLKGRKRGPSGCGWPGHRCTKVDLSITQAQEAVPVWRPWNPFKFGVPPSRTAFTHFILIIT